MYLFLLSPCQLVAFDRVITSLSAHAMQLAVRLVFCVHTFCIIELWTVWLELSNTTLAI